MPDYQIQQAELGGAAPDAGLAAISAGFAAGAGPAFAAAALEARGAGTAGGHPGKLVSADDVWPLEAPPQSTQSASGSIDPVDWGPPTGFAWRITEVAIVLGAGTSLVQIYKMSALGAANLRFQTSASGLWEPSRMYLLPGARIVAVSTGGGVTIAPDGERIRLGFLPTYMA